MRMLVVVKMTKMTKMLVVVRMTRMTHLTTFLAITSRAGVFAGCKMINYVYSSKQPTVPRTE